MTFQILRPSVLEPAPEQPLAEALRLSVLAAEARYGPERVRRRWETGLRNHPTGVWLFEWLDPDATWTEMIGPTRAEGFREMHGPRWKSISHYATDVGCALDLLQDATRRGYRVQVVVQEDGEIHKAAVLMQYYGWDTTPPPAEWAHGASARATGRSAEAEAITLAYLTLTRSIHPLEAACPQ